jgi:hypothetical protein
MLKQILSVRDVKKLKVGDQLFNHSELQLAKTYTIQNISDGMVYAIHENGYHELKILQIDYLPQDSWWVIP